ncbi:helix-turn-helix transcriptional regulator [Georgenia subflava]|uniref:WYL domain-containing protein n=1 Tax=Georgenia subflava TaxID=1622177 RepID=A0A6N7EQV6_9MICO|nr:WYL domain-containing protein [Georgenia subflava]MPV38905.1 WYL domain-containing protein [Georgenia subflava]
MAENTAERVTRLLALVAYLNEHPGAPVADVAEHFSATEAQVLADVNLLWVSGTPGYLPDDLIDFSAEALDHGRLTLTDARGMDRPLRLSSSEALALLLALRSLRELAERQPGLDPGAGALESALGKLTAATGRAAEQAASVEVRVHAEAPAATLATLQGAVEARRRVHLRYVSAADVVTERDVDPVELRSDGVTWALRAWCHRAQGARTFRLDRILDLAVLDEGAAEHPEIVSGPATGWEGDGRTVTLELASQARWVAEHAPVESVTDLPDGDLRVVLRAGDPAWVTNLLLSLGESVRAVAPTELARDVATRARRALDAYDHLS